MAVDEGRTPMRGTHTHTHTLMAHTLMAHTHTHTHSWHTRHVMILRGHTRHTTVHTAHGVSRTRTGMSTATMANILTTM